MFCDISPQDDIQSFFYRVDFTSDQLCGELDTRIYVIELNKINGRIWYIWLRNTPHNEASNGIGKLVLTMPENVSKEVAETVIRKNIERWITDFEREFRNHDI